MAKIESLNTLIKEAEGKAAAQQEKAILKAEKKAANKDQVITLDLEGRNGGFREKASALPALTEKIKAVGKWISDKWTNRKSLKLQTFMPYEETTEGRYKAAYEKAQAEAAAGVKKVEELQAKAKVLETQREEVIALGDEWANQHEEPSEAPVAAAKTETAAPVAEEDLREEWSSQHEAGNQTMEAEPEEKVSEVKASEAAGFYEYSPKALEKMSALAGMIERAGVKVEGGFAGLVEGLKTGQLSKEQKLLAIDAIAQLQKGHKWDKKNGAILKELSQNFGYETKNGRKVEQSGLGDVLEQAAEKFTEERKKKEAFTKLGDLIIKTNPLKSGNKVLGEALISQNLSVEDYPNAIKALDQVKQMYRANKTTVEQLNTAKHFLDLQFGAKEANVESSKVIEMPKNSPATRKARGGDGRVASITRSREAQEGNHAA